MAVLNTTVTDVVDELLSTTLRNYRKKLSDNVSRGLPLLYWLEQGGRKRTMDGGYQIVIPILYGINNTTQTYSGYDTISVTPQKGITSAYYGWKNAAVSISISREEERKNSGGARLIDLLEAKTQQAEMSLRWYLADMFHGRHGSGKMTYVGEDTNTVDSVGGALVDSTTGTSKNFNSLDHLVRMPWGQMDHYTPALVTHAVGKVEVKTTPVTASMLNYADFYGTWTSITEQNTWWMNYSSPGFQKSVRDTTNSTVKLGAPTTDTENINAGYIGNMPTGTMPGTNLINVMRSMYYRLTDDGDAPDLILCNQSPYEIYEGALQPLERFTDTALADAGFSNLKFHTCRMMMDNGIVTPLPTATVTAAAPATPMYFLNSQYLEWIVDTQTDFVTTPFFRPPNQIARTAQILLMAQLVCSNRSKQGVIACANYSGGYHA